VPEWYDQPVFYFSNAQSLMHHGVSVAAPADCVKLDYELELGIVIGKPGRNIQVQEAWNHIAGFTIVNDFSARDTQRKEMKVGLGPSKGKDFATAVGPKLVSIDSLRDRIDTQDRISLDMTASVNGIQLSAGNSSSMHFTWPQIVAHASRDVTLVPGELLGSGTVGTGCILELGPENTDGWLKSGDVVELSIESLGTLKNTIA
jgi:fumarylacetoacetate (FAA) hydrolase